MLSRLINIGFEEKGHWILDKTAKFKLTISDNDLNCKKVLYAFIIDNEIMYIGKTIQTIRKRFYGYINPGNTQVTNIRINEKILNELKNKKQIKIYIFQSKSKEYETFNLNLSAGLEDDIILQTNPIWNINGK